MRTWKELYEEANSIPHEGVEGVMSCSQISDLLACGEYQGSNTSGEAAKQGTAIHYALELGELPEDADDDTQVTYHYCKRTIEYYEKQGWTVHSREKYYATDLLTGKIDVLMTQGDNWLCIDYKTGFVPVENFAHQFAGNAYLLYKCEDVKGGIYSVVSQVGNRNEPYLWEEELVFDTIDRALNQKEVKAGSHCTYCCKASVCSKRLNNLSVTAATVAKLNNDIITSKDAGELYSLGKTLEKVGQAIKDRMSSEAKSGLKIEGAKLVKGRKTITMAPPVEVFRALKDKYELDSEEFFNNCTVSPAYIKKVIGETDFSKEQLMTGFFKEGYGSDYLMKVKV